MKIKKLWKLYKELRSLRRRVKVLNSDLTFVNQRYNALFYEKSQEVPYSTMTIMIPNVFRIEAEYRLGDMNRRPIANHIYKMMSDEMKLKLVDDLFKQGYIRKVQDDAVGEVYEIKVVR